MSFVADLHIHSRFSRACSKQLNIPNLVQWSRMKGISLLGTGDFLHPVWLSELKSQLKEDGSGFLTHNNSGIKFLLTVEVASIYTDKTKSRRIHNLIFLPSFEAVYKFRQSLLSKKANLSADGRPIVGISSKDLLYMALESSGKAIFIPAHLWTPWFGTFGSKSGYDSLKDCFEDLTDYVLGIETGLSSDPPMNWRVKELDLKSILSFSDAHSLPNLGREATILKNDLDHGYDGFWDALKTQNLAGTIEFFPEEGKYHFTGHRNCQVKYTPHDTQKNGSTCPVCKKPLTVGVLERVEELASLHKKELGPKKQERPGYKMLVPLLQIIAEALKSTPQSKKVLSLYQNLIDNLETEIQILIKTNLSDIEKLAGPKIAEGVNKVRKGDLKIDPGFDGVYGKVSIWS